MSFDPDDDRWAARAAEVALDGGAFTMRFRVSEFMNPWHDEIGRFAPKGTGTKSDGRTRLVGSKSDTPDLPSNFSIDADGTISREVHIPNDAYNADVVTSAMALFHVVAADGHPVDRSQALGKLKRDADVADPELVEKYIKPAARALAEGDLEEAHDLISQADKLVFTPFVEKFKLPPPEKVDVQYDEEGKIHYTLTADGNMIMFHPRMYDVSPEQVQTILSAATTAMRAGGVDQDINIQIQGSWDRDTMSWDTHTMGFVHVDPDGGSNRHRTIQLTPELIKGNFDPDGVTPRADATLTAAGQLTEPLRQTVIHEMGHVALFEEAVVRRGGDQEWFNQQMTATSTNTTFKDIPLMSTYAQENTVENHAEAFMEWTATGGTTNNPWVQRMATLFGWSEPAMFEEEMPIAAAGPPPEEPLIPIFTYPEEPVTLIDGVDGPSYQYGAEVVDDVERAIHDEILTASAAQFMNPWHDEIGRFAPKGSGRKFDAAAAADEVLAGNPIEIDGADGPDLVMQWADLDHAVDLTLVTIDGSHMFSTMREKGRTRTEMPQIPAAHHAEFEQRLADSGVVMLMDEVDPRTLLATQSELDGRAVGQMVRGKREGGWDYLSRPLLVSSDGHLIDGHHRWAAAAVESAACDGCVKIGIIRVAMPIEDLLAFADDFTDELGIRRLHVSEHKRGGGLVAAANENETVKDVIFATDEEDGITDEQLADLPHGDGSAFTKGETVVASGLYVVVDNRMTVVDVSNPTSPAEFANPWHDEIGRFAPKGTGTKVGFDGDAASELHDEAMGVLADHQAAMDEAYKLHFERGGQESTSTFSQARDEYLAYGSSEMDRQLRKHGDDKVANAAHRRALTDAVVMDEAIERSGFVFEEETVLLRGIRNTQAGNLTAGTTFTDPAFVSVTASPGEAAQASGQQYRPAGFPAPTNPGTIVALKIPAGTKAMPGQDLEKEWVLPRGGKYTVTNIIEGDGVRIAEVEVTFPNAPPVTAGIPTIDDMISRVGTQRETRGKLDEERGLAAAAGGNIVHERLSWDLGDFATTMTARRAHWVVTFPVTPEAAQSFANPWHDQIGRFAPKGSGTNWPPGTGKNFPSESQNSTGIDTDAVAADVIAGRDVTVNGADVDDVLLEFATAGRVIDMTRITVEGSDTMFSQMRENGRPRDNMPQIPVEMLGDFQQKLREAGIPFKPEVIDPQNLKATQSELDGHKVGKIIRDLRAGEFDLSTDPLWVSSDGHILDGHHRWAGAAAMSADCGGCFDVPIIRVDIPMNELLAFGDNYNAQAGIEKQGMGAPMPHELKKKQAAAIGDPPEPEQEFEVYGMATDAADGVLDEDLVDLPHGDGSAFPPPEQPKFRVIKGGQFANPWHDEIGRFAPKGSGTKSAGPSERAKKALAPDVEMIKLTDIGIEDATPEQAEVAQSTRDDDALWENAEPRKVSWQDRFVGTEGQVKAKHVRKVVIGGEPLREGYPPRVYELPDGRYLIADGHHRVVMHNMLESPEYEVIVLPYPED